MVRLPVLDLVFFTLLEDEPAAETKSSTLLVRSTLFLNKLLPRDDRDDATPRLLLASELGVAKGSEDTSERECAFKERA